MHSRPNVEKTIGKATNTCEEFAEHIRYGVSTSRDSPDMNRKGLSIAVGLAEIKMDYPRKPVAIHRP
jgi:hypothetical protein